MNADSKIIRFETPRFTIVFNHQRYSTGSSYKNVAGSKRRREDKMYKNLIKGECKQRSIFAPRILLPDSCETAEVHGVYSIRQGSNNTYISTFQWAVNRLVKHLQGIKRCVDLDYAVRWKLYKCHYHDQCLAHV